MTNEQALRADMLARLDELDRMAEMVSDSDVQQYIADRKKEIRKRLDKLSGS